MILKKEILENFIKENKAESCTLIGVPTQEVVYKIVKGDGNVGELFDKYDIRYTYYDDLVNDIHGASVSVYIPFENEKYITNICAVTIENPTLKQFKQIENLFESIEEYYQADITAPIIDHIVGINKTPIEFSDMLSIIPAKSQAEIAEKVGKSRQLITDIKSGKSHVTFDLLGSLMKEYPLLPWDYFIKGN